MIDTVIFDLDGTLLDTLYDLCTSVNHVLSAHGYPIRSLLEVKSFVGNGVPKLVERSMPSNCPIFDVLLSEFKLYYGEHCHDTTKAYDGVISALTALKRDGMKIGVVSNKLDGAVKSLCNRYFGSLIDIAVGERVGIEKKPAPDSVFEVIKKLGSSRAVYIGDSDVDIKTAENAGIPCISVTWGFREKSFLLQSGGYMFADDTQEMLEIIERLKVDGYDDTRKI